MTTIFSPPNTNFASLAKPFTKIPYNSFKPVSHAHRSRRRPPPPINVSCFIELMRRDGKAGIITVSVGFACGNLHFLTPYTSFCVLARLMSDYVSVCTIYGEESAYRDSARLFNVTSCTGQRHGFRKLNVFVIYCFMRRAARWRWRKIGSIRAYRLCCARTHSPLFWETLRFSSMPIDGAI